jgi:hypothetical protein
MSFVVFNNVKMLLTRLLKWVRIRDMGFYATFNNISVILWWSVLLVEEAGVPGEKHRPVNDKLYHIMLC